MPTYTIHFKSDLSGARASVDVEAPGPGEALQHVMAHHPVRHRSRVTLTTAEGAKLYVTYVAPRRVAASRPTVPPEPSPPTEPDQDVARQLDALLARLVPGVRR